VEEERKRIKGSGRRKRRWKERSWRRKRGTKWRRGREGAIGEAAEKLEDG
jgi:hypothetical protein